MTMFDACICNDGDDGESPQFSRTSIVKARKEHRCCECRAPIKPGERHEVVRGKWGNRFETFRTCLPCRRVRASLLRCGYVFGYLWDDVHAAFCEGEECVCP